MSTIDPLSARRKKNVQRMENKRTKRKRDGKKERGREEKEKRKKGKNTRHGRTNKQPSTRVASFRGGADSRTSLFYCHERLCVRFILYQFFTIYRKKTRRTKREEEDFCNFRHFSLVERKKTAIQPRNRVTSVEPSRRATTLYVFVYVAQTKTKREINNNNNNNNKINKIPRGEG